MNREKIQAFLALFTATFFWASAYIFVNQLLEDVSPYMILSLRFSFAAIILVFIYNEKPSLSDIIVSVICMIGVFFILGNNLGSFHIGDIYCILCAVDYALYIVISSKYSKLYDSGILNVLQVSTTAVLSILSLVLIGNNRFALNFADGFQLIYLTVFCTTLPFFLILYGMKHVSATTSGVLLSLESVMAAVMGIILLHESFTPNLIIGGAIVIFSFILSEVLPKILRN